MADPNNMSDEEKMAAEWASMEGGGDQGGGGGGGDATARVLNQDEIDSLLGFDAGGGLRARRRWLNKVRVLF